MSPFEGVVYGKDGRALGRWNAKRRPLNAKERKWVAHFLENVTKQREDHMAFKKQDDGARQQKNPTRNNDGKEQSTTEQCNMVFLAGPVASRIGIHEDRHAMFLIDCGPDKKFVKCTIRDSGELVDRVDQYQKGDYIRITGYVRIWGKKDGDEWTDNWEIRVTEIKSKPPERVRDFPKRNATITDDDVPF